MYMNLSRSNQRLRQGVSARDVYYLLNPSKDLSHTENHFKVRFEELKHRDDCNWDGLVDEAPTPDELQKMLQRKDIYVHLGDGVRYLGDLNESVVNCLTLVVGSWSAALSNTIRMVESYGPPYYFLINGCPGYVGCLWTVVDDDIDRFTERLLKLTNIDDPDSVPKCASITKAVQLSRDACKLKYLTGAAPVIWGLPISMRSFGPNHFP